MAKHYAIDRAHLALCGTCTCSDKSLEFTKDFKAVNCEACRAEIDKAMAGRKEQDRKEGGNAR